MPYNLTTMQSIFCNNKEITQIRYNGSLVYQKQSGPDYTEPFYVENITNSNETLSIKKDSSSAPTLTIEYSTNKSTWQTLGTTSTTALSRTVAPGEKLYLRCNTNSWSAAAINNYNMISGTSKVGGNIMSLLYGDSFVNKTSFPSGSNYSLCQLFMNNTTLVNASDLLLPATILVGYCYSAMFYNCTSLTSIPVLPATTLATWCYESMFCNCTSLTSAPSLPATTLSDYCYYNMFRGCNSLTSAPVLPATTLVDKCYQQMFLGCITLTSVTCLATSGINTNESTSAWLNLVSPTGTFTKAAGVTWPTGVNGIPEGWTVVEV